MSKRFYSRPEFSDRNNKCCCRNDDLKPIEKNVYLILNSWGENIAVISENEDKPIIQIRHLL